MRVSMVSSISNASPIKPVQRVVRRKPSLVSDQVEPEPTITPPVITAVSEFAAHRSKDETTEKKDYQKRNPLWNTMLNLG